MQTKIPVGSDDFKSIREEYYFVDKSGFISEFFHQHASVTLLTRPRRFGKSLLMSMMWYFLKTEDADENRKLFEGLKVAEDPQAMAEQGRRPVVFLTLKDWMGLTWESMQETIRWRLAHLFGNFLFVRDDVVSEDEAEKFDLIYHRKANGEVMEDALAFLIRLLKRHTGIKPVLLIDEYDAPIQEAWSQGYYKDAIGFFRQFYTLAFKSNPSLGFAILTGVLRVAKESIFSGLNNLVVSSVLSGPYADACGYTRAEMEKMVRDLGKEDQLEVIQSWYDGYDFQGLEIYTPWSVNNFFFNKCEARAYWVNTSSNSILQTMLERLTSKRERDLERLVAGGSIVMHPNEAFIYDDIEQHRDDIYTLLLFTGYLKCTGIESIEDEDTEEQLYELSIPNREIRSVFRSEILRRMSGFTGVSMLYTMMQAMMAGDAMEFNSSLREVLRGMVSVHDTAHAESFYHGLMLGLTVWLNKKFRIESNQESGYGRFDLALFPKREGLPGVLMEFKSVKDDADLEKAVEAAKVQMKEKDYRARFDVLGVKKLWSYAIAFCGKDVRVDMVDGWENKTIVRE